MILILIIIGIATIIIGTVLGFLSGSAVGFIVALGSSIVSAVIFFALAKVLENQDTIMSMMYELKKELKNPSKEVICAKCAKTYTSEYSYCPHCGTKP